MGVGAALGSMSGMPLSTTSGVNGGTAAHSTPPCPLEIHIRLLAARLGVVVSALSRVVERAC